mmetsp:Transcript_57042/g.135463  ORF Transcript_57042/g.135463 Transcript_57042/m.135463 type:complete len:138 (-) Transcript_57042:66-479(-)|eukprot:CAMPEP_0180167830 /NCGR_PEP_ID=MMETSP0986-20121125/32343_1 /TAXON_ID=697907 /ORGANISM="non described non described, Strain CCMP2293" /LENGTH=137 /DNA_ID=CAMNT_0022119161 /DNA_START=47 /DNA_END=460 /DNA_ORIENTATION=+
MSFAPACTHDFAELILAPASTNDPAEDVACVMTPMVRSPSALFKLEQLLFSGDVKSPREVDSLLRQLKILQFFSSGTQDVLEVTTRSACDSALLLQLRVSVTAADLAPRRSEKVKTTLNSAAAWEALGRRFQERLKA